MVKWIGASITLIEQKKVVVGLPDKVAEELAQDCENMLEKPTVELKELRRFVGRSS